MTGRRDLRSPLLAVAGSVLAGCAITGGTLGGRETCWPDREQRAPSLWRGILRVDARGGRLDTPEGDVIQLSPGELTFAIDGAGGGTLVQGDRVVARAGDDVTLFGGAGADGLLVVCAVEERHGS